MAVTQRVQTEPAILRTLSKAEIDRRIERMWSEILAGPALVSDPGEDETRPVWISTSELVRRMQPFLGKN